MIVVYPRKRPLHAQCLAISFFHHRNYGSCCRSSSVAAVDDVADDRFSRFSQNYDLKSKTTHDEQDALLGM